MNATSSRFDVQTGQFNGLPAWIIRGETADAAISMQGGQLLSWRPHGHEEVLWLSPDTRQPPQPIRGGVPICWPYFGRQGQAADAPQHGHARTSTWQWVDAVVGDEDEVIVDLALPVDARSPLRLRQRLHIGRSLRQGLITHNTGSSEVLLSQALHSYFAVGDATAVTVTGLDGLPFEDKLAGGRHTQTGAWHLRDGATPGRADRVYATRGEGVLLHDAARERWLHIESRGSHSLVLWNPGAEGTPALGDVAADGWRGFVCVEVANAGADGVRLAPGQSHGLVQSVVLSDTAPHSR